MFTHPEMVFPLVFLCLRRYLDKRAPVLIKRLTSMLEGALIPNMDVGRITIKLEWREGRNYSEPS